MKLRDLPSVDELAREGRFARWSPPAVVEAARTVLARAREEIQAGFDPGDLARRVEEELAEARRWRLRRVMNATGVIVHTNLGRAPLAEAAVERVREVGSGYSNLEYDLAQGGRGSRQDHVAAILRRLTGAEAALVVNNNAAAVLLALAALAALEGTLALYLDSDRAVREVPVLRMLAEPIERVRSRAERLAASTAGAVEETVARVGGGALPLAELPSFACALEESLAAPLRLGEPPLVGVVRDGRLLLG